jgi:putative flippase GtrA
MRISPPISPPTSSRNQIRFHHLTKTPEARLCVPGVFSYDILSAMMISKILKYGVAGGAAFILDFILVYFLFAYTTVHYVIVVPIAFIFGTFLNYGINHIWGFKETPRSFKTGYFYFLQIALVGVLLTVAIMIEYMHVDKLFARVIAAGLVFIWGFSANYFLNFKTHKSQSSKAEDVLQ